VSVGLTDSATVSGTIPGLEAGGEYLLMARAHSRNQTTTYYIFWSGVAHKEVPCKATGVGSSTGAVVAPVVRTNGATDTTWLEVFRHNGNSWFGGEIDFRNNITLPDYVEAHNMADFEGAFKDRWSTVYNWETNSSFTRYCIEMQVVELHNVTTANQWVPATSQFSDFTSCNHGNCECMVTTDRELNGQPREQREAICGHNQLREDECECSAQRLADSEKYIGMVPSHGGRWYSMPGPGYCPLGARVGDAGCTYRVSPLAHSLSLGHLYNRGVFSWRPWRRSVHWLQIARAAFDDIGAVPCGGAASEIREEIMV